MVKQLFTAVMTLLVIGAAALPTQALPIFTDDFESYVDSTQMKAPGNWGDNASTGNPSTLGIAGANQFLSHPGGVVAQHNFPAFIPTDSTPLVFEFDIVDNGATNKRVTAALRDFGTTNTFIEMGRYNAAGNPAAPNIDGYAIRTAFLAATPAGSGGWLLFPTDLPIPATNVDPRLAAGTHGMKATIRTTDITFELDLQSDGVVDSVLVVNTASAAGKDYNVIRLGGPSDLSSPGGALGFDNVSLGAFEPKLAVFNTINTFNTGVSDTGDTLPGNAVDPHYSVHRVGAADAPVNLGVGAPTFVVPQDGFPIPPWLANSADSAWISSTQNDDANEPGGFFDYNLMFDAVSTNALIEGSWAMDDFGVDIFLNGIATGNTNANGFGALTDFSISDGFVAGENVLTFRVRNDPGNGPNPTGLRVEITNFQSSIIPEPATAVFGLLALAALGVRRRRVN